MDRKRVIITCVVVAVLAGLVFLQIHAWRKFDWAIFAGSLKELNWWYILGAIALIHLADGLRAIRWAIFLKAAKPTSAIPLLPAQYIGFAALALLGRPGEIVRPYVIAKKTGLSLASQLAVWTVERIFDISAVTSIVALDLLFARSLSTFTDNQYSVMRALGGALVLIAALLLFFAFLVWKNGTQIADWVNRKLARRYPHTAHAMASKVRTFSSGLHTIHDVGSFIHLAFLSILIWLLIACSYYVVLQSYADPNINTMTFVYGIILMAFSVAGGVLQLPVVGGGSQLLTINALYWLFNNPKELATSCGIMLWLVTFVSVTPAGLILARLEHVSIRKVSKQSHREEKQIESRA